MTATPRYAKRMTLASIFCTLSILLSTSTIADTHRPFTDVRGALSGSWYDTSRNGEGFVFEFGSNPGSPAITVYWFTHKDGEPYWLYGAVEYDAALFDQTGLLQVDMLEVSGTGFGGDFDPEALTHFDRGTLSFLFESCDQALALWVPEEGSHNLGTAAIEYELRRITLGLDGVACSATKPANESTDSLPRKLQGTLSGSWFDRSLNGQGFVFEFGLNPDSAVATAYWFTHRDGKPYWLFGVAPYEGDEPLLDFELLDVSGTGFGKDFDAEDINITTWGRAAFGFTGCTEGFAIWTDQANTSGLFDLERITLGLDGADCQAATQRLTWVSFERPLEARSTVSVMLRDDVIEPTASQFSFSLRGGATNRLPTRRSFFDRNIEIGVSGLLFKELAALISPRLATTAMSHDMADHAAPASTPIVARSEGRTTSKTTLATPLSTAPFSLAENGITVLCPEASAGDTGVIDGVTYTKRARDQITTDNAATTCTSGITDMSGLFREKATFNQPIGHWDTSSVTTMEFMFTNAKAFNQPIDYWDTSQVTNMGFMFSNTAVFNQALPWDTSRVTSMYGMFETASAFNQPIGDWDTSAVIYMGLMFFSATAFNQPIGNWDTSNVITTEFMFGDASAFDQPLTNWDTSNIINMEFMFVSSAFNQPIGNWDTSSVTNLRFMFLLASAFNQPIGNWDTSQVTDMSGLFLEASAFNQPIGEWDTTNVTNMAFMFARALAFNQSLGNWDTSSVQVGLNDIAFMAGMFSHAKSFNQDLSSWCVPQFNGAPPDFDAATEQWTLPKPNWGAGCDGVFFRASNGITVMCPIAQTGDTGIVDGVLFTKRTREQITTENAATTCTSGITNMSSLFENEASFNEDLSHWDTSSVTTMERMFSAASAFNQDIGKWDTRAVSSMRAMFQSATSFNRDLSAWCASSMTTKPTDFDLAATSWAQPRPNWGADCNDNFFLAVNGITLMCPNAELGEVGVIGGVSYTKRSRNQITTANAATTCTSGITNLSRLFSDETSFNQPIAHWDTSQVTNMALMFLNAQSFNRPIDMWDTSQVVSMELMFSSARRFNQPIGDWSTGSVVYMTGMFLDARAFNQDLSGWCVATITTQPTEFDVLATSWRLDRPKWGAACRDI